MVGLCLQSYPTKFEKILPNLCLYSSKTGYGHIYILFIRWYVLRDTHHYAMIALPLCEPSLPSLASVISCCPNITMDSISGILLDIRTIWHHHIIALLKNRSYILTISYSLVQNVGLGKRLLELRESCLKSLTQREPDDPRLESQGLLMIGLEVSKWGWPF